MADNLATIGGVPPATPMWYEHTPLSGYHGRSIMLTAQQGLPRSPICSSNYHLA